MSEAPIEETEADEPADSDGDADLNAVLTKLSEEEIEVSAEDAGSVEFGVPVLTEVVDAAWAEAVISTEVVEETDGSASNEGPADVPDVAGVQTPASVRGPRPADEVPTDAVDEPVGETEVPAQVETEAVGGFRIASWPWSKHASEVEEPAVIIDLDEPEQVEEPKESGSEEPETAEESVSIVGPQPVAPVVPNESDAEAASDFIDLEALVQEIEPAPEPPGYRGEDVSSSVNMACTDCIYVETCPHAGERDPSSCGSFQWK